MKSKHVMVIEDEPFLRETICTVLEEAGHKTVPMANGLEAMEYLGSSQLKPDVILLDLIMPEMDGWQFRETQLLVADTALIPVIVMTSSSDLRGIDASEVIPKPFEIDQLLAVVERQGQTAARPSSRSPKDRAGKDPDAQGIYDEAWDVAGESQYLITRINALEHASEINESFVGIACHDLRNPLNAITMAADYLSRKGLPEDVDASVRRIYGSARRMRRMISQLLDVTRLQAGRDFGLSRTKESLAELTQSFVDRFRGECDREVQLKVVGDSLAEVDRERTTEVLTTLIENACLHGKADQPVRVIVDGSDPDLVSVNVTSAGVIPETIRGSVFDPMRRAAEGIPATTGTSGMGFGLYIAQQIANAHGGTLEFDSSEAKGTCFTVTLPRVNVAAQAESLLNVAGRAV